MYTRITRVIQMEELRNKAEKDLKVFREMVSVYVCACNAYICTTCTCTYGATCVMSSYNIL